MRDLLERVPGERFAGDAYWDQFERDFWRTGQSGTWKLERLQTFQEPDDDSWIACSRGDWQQALDLISARDADLRDEYRRIDQHGFRSYRVRVADKPITPYLQWEFHCFEGRQRAGENIRVIGSEEVAPFEGGGVFPEIVTLGTDVMYEIRYNEEGVHEGGIRFTDQGLISRFQKVIRDLYGIGEDLVSFFEREIRPLAAPAVLRR